MNSSMMLANGAGIASVLDTDHVSQFLCTAHSQSFYLQEEGFSQALPLSDQFTSSSLCSTHHK